jgi:hypothetical protein
VRVTIAVFNLEEDNHPVTQVRAEGPGQVAQQGLDVGMQPFNVCAV